MLLLGEKDKNGPLCLGYILNILLNIFLNNFDPLSQLKVNVFDLCSLFNKIWAVKFNENSIKKIKIFKINNDKETIRIKLGGYPPTHTFNISIV